MLATMCPAAAEWNKNTLPNLRLPSPFKEGHCCALLRLYFRSVLQFVSTVPLQSINANAVASLKFRPFGLLHLKAMSTCRRSLDGSEFQQSVQLYFRIP
jgi:hypothetical protein